MGGVGRGANITSELGEKDGVVYEEIKIRYLFQLGLESTDSGLVSKCFFLIAHSGIQSAIPGTDSAGKQGAGPGTRPSLLSQP